MDELRVSAVVRSSNWVWASYMTMASNTTVLQAYGPALAATNLSVANVAPVVINANSAYLNGSLVSTGGAPVTTVTVYWGTTDGGTTAAAWSNATPVSVSGPGLFTLHAGGLLPETQYYYRCFVNNTLTTAWASSSLTLVTPPDPNAFKQRVKITFAGYTPAETLTNFPALVVLGTNIAGFSYARCSSTNGYDLRFASSNATQMLNYEMDTWNTNGPSYVWVQVPALSGAADYIWAYCGNAQDAAAPAVYTTNGATWGNSYLSVFHMNQTNVTDSSRASGNGTSYGNTNAAGRIGVGQGFGSGGVVCSSAGAHIGLPSGPFNSFPNGYTLSAWIYPTSASGWEHIMEFSSTSGLNRDKIYLCRSNATTTVCLGSQQGSASCNIVGAPVLQQSTWQHVEASESASGAVTVYYNGLPVASGVTSITLSAARINNLIGMSPAGGDHYYGGLMDEVRVSSVVRSPNWVWASYQTMASNSTFTTYQSLPLTRGFLCVFK